MSEQRIDFILFGVTGLVGRYGVRHLHKLLTESGSKLTWGVAGRDETKIRQTLLDLKKRTKDAVGTSNIPIFLADMSDSSSVDRMVGRTKVLINACGPLREYGEVLIEACLKHKTHYVDVSAEPNFIEKIQLKYNEKAKLAGVHVVNSCGVDSLTYDMGIEFLKEKFIGTINSVETYFRSGADGSPIPGPEFNNSTWKSAIDLMVHSDELRKIRRENKMKFPNLKPKLNLRLIPFKPKIDEGWAYPSITADLSVMRRTQYHLYKENNIRPIQIQSYMMFKYFWHIFLFYSLVILFAIFTKFEATRNLLLEHPDVFSAGVFGKGEPSEEKLNNGWFRLTLVAKGWRDHSDLNKKIPNKRAIAKIEGRNQGYGSTSLCLVLAGIVLLEELVGKNSKKVGVLTPGAAFGKTSLTKRLNKNGISFELLEKSAI